MKLFNKKKETRSLPMGRKGKSAFAVYTALVLMLCCCTTTAFAARDPLTVINNLSDFIFDDPGHWYDPAGLWRGTDRPFPEKPRPQPAGQRLPHFSWRRRDYVCKGNPHAHYGLIFQRKGVSL